MASKSLFKSLSGVLIPRGDTVNEAGGVAYALSAEHALAQYAVTGCLNSTFYATDEGQLGSVLQFAYVVEPEFVARVAIYARREGFMKDLPALLCAVRAVRSPGLLAEVFDRVIDDGRMLRNFVQIVRSGVTGRKSLGSLPKRLVQQWLASRSDEQLFRASVGNDPSLADVIRMVHPKPATESRRALYAYLIGREHDASALPAIVQQFEAFKRGEGRDVVPDVPFQLLTSLELSQGDWRQIARTAPWQMTRMNLSTFVRHGVFEGESGPELTKLIAERLRDESAIRKAKAFPYQLMVAYSQSDDRVPNAVKDALQDAMEVAISNVPKIDGNVFVCPDVSGSMQSPVTGYRRGATTAVRCIDVAALVAAAVLRANPDAAVIPFSDSVVPCTLNRRDTVITNATKLANLPSGGTNCSAPLAMLNKQRAKGDLVIYVSDNESWVDQRAGRGTATMQEWMSFKQRNPRARLVCIDIQPYAHTQAAEQADVLNIGGFSDRVFDVIAKFAERSLTNDHWVGVIKQVAL